MSLRYITLHYIAFTLHYIAHYIHCITLHYTASHYITHSLHITPHYTTLHYTTHLHTYIHTYLRTYIHFHNYLHLYISICYPAPKIYLLFFVVIRYWKINGKRNSGHGTEEKRTGVFASTQVRQSCGERYVRGLTWRGLIRYALVGVPRWK